MISIIVLPTSVSFISSISEFRGMNISDGETPSDRIYKSNHYIQKYQTSNIGDANKSVDKILALEEMFGSTRFSAHMDFGTPSHATLIEVN